MAILAGDIKLVASQVMDDVDEGGGAPTSVVIEDNVSNAVFNDISESDRAGGRINMRKLNVSVQTDNRDTYLGANVIVAEPPNDPNVAITIFKANGAFDRRTDAQNQLESYSIRGPVWSGYLLENHVMNMRSIQIFQRPGTAQPNINRTLCLVYNEGLPGEREQYVRITRVESEIRTFTEIVGGTAVNFDGEVLTCEISDRLRYDFPGSPASRDYAPAPTATKLRDTTVADAGSYFGVVPLEVPADIGDISVKAESVYTQLVPSARTETTALDQRPAAERTITIATTPRQVSVAASPHTMRIKIGQENRGFSYVQILKPFPTPNSVVISYRALGNWYTVMDDGSGTLTGSGAGTVNYANGSIALTLPSLPDVGSSIIFSWGEASAFVNRSAQTNFRAPEFAFQLEHDNGIAPGTLEITWLSAGVLKTAVANATGQLSGDATGEVQHASGVVRLVPSAMLDAGGTFTVNYERVTTVTESFPSVAVDAGGFATLTLADPPAQGSINVRWITVRNVSVSSGAQAGGTSATKTDASSQVVSIGRPQMPPLPSNPSPDELATKPPGETVRVPVGGDTSQPPQMMPGGLRLSDSTPVYVAVYPVRTDTGVWFYEPPIATGAMWTEAEYNLGEKTINGVLYDRWGTHTS